ncbi:MAG TPA: hypothetical protein PKA64_10535, partial [Myxococcota bacterium]|nr:hypothetical protein [Myxococcota bacterium]
KCWGYNGYGQLGQGNTTQRGDDAGEMGAALAYTNLGTGRKAVSLQSGEYHTCAALDDASVKCWGNAQGLGYEGTVRRGDNANEMGDNLPTVPLPSGTEVNQVTAGGAYACAVTTCGELYCWGENAYGQVGVGVITATIASPTVPVDLGTLHYVPTSSARTCNLNRRPPAPGVDISRVGGGLRCDVVAPSVDADGDPVAYAVSWQLEGSPYAGATSTAALPGDTIPAGSVTIGKWTCVVTPSDATGAGPAGVDDFLAYDPALDVVDTIGTHTCAVLEDGSVRCFGYNGYGQLGMGNTLPWGDNPGDLGDNMVPVNLGAGRTATEIATGWYHTCALLDGGDVRCWGRNDYGELGLSRSGQVGDAANEVGDDTIDPLVNLGTGRTAVHVDGGAYMTCAVLDDGGVKCWGYASDERLGAPPQQNRGINTATMGDNLPYTDLGVGVRAVDVTVGEAHACALLDDGSVKCWGYNNYGQLGYEDTTNRGTHEREMGDWLRPVNLGGGTVVEVDAGRYHTCARFVDGRVKCWGYNGYGQLGQGNTTQRGDEVGEMGAALAYANLGTGRKAVSLRSGEYHTCAALDDGSVKCWGNAQGLGYDGTIRRGDGANEMGDNLPTVPLPSGTTVSQVTAGGAYACAVTTCGELYCWGENAYGQVGVGVIAATIATPTVPVDLGTLHYVPTQAAQVCNVNRRPSAPRIDVVRVDAGGSYGLRCDLVAASVDPDGDAVSYAVAWAFEGAPWLGPASTTSRAGDTILPANVEEGKWTCSVTPSDATGPGEPGVDSLLAYDPALDVIDSAGTHMCAVLEDGSVKCFGYNGYGQLGIGSTLPWGNNPGDLGDNAEAVNLGAGKVAVEVATGWYHTCARFDDGGVRCWGRNDYGELGLSRSGQVGDAANEVGDDTLDPLVNLGAGRSAVAVDAGAYMTCAVLDDGTVKCWGYSSDERLGATPQANRGLNTATMGDNLPLTEIGAHKKALDVAVGEAHACALLDDGSVKCWGYNNYGQLGYGDTTNRGTHPREMGDWLRPVDLGGGTVVEVDAGRYHSCARFVDGRIKCWGYNGYGQLGQGNTTQRGDEAGEMGAALAYADLGAGRAAVSMQAGEYHTCAALDDGSVKCWGNAQGLGYDGTVRRGDGANEMGDNLPTVSLPLGVVVDQVSAGGGHTCALTACGEAYCWGENAYGQVATGVIGATIATPTVAVDFGTLHYVPSSSARTCNVNRRPSAPRVDIVRVGGASYDLRCDVVDPSIDPDGDAISYTVSWKREGVAWTGATATTTLPGDTIPSGEITPARWTCTVTPSDATGPGDAGVDRYVSADPAPDVIDTSGDHLCAALEDGSVRCLGYNGFGQLGIGSTLPWGDN